MHSRLVLAGLMVALSCVPAAADNILFILDSSGSMAGKLDDGRTKIQSAKSSLSSLMADLPSETKVGLMVYGHRYDRKAPEACTDIELLAAVGQSTWDKLETSLKAIVPTGKTPIATSLEQTTDAFIGFERGNNNVVLISDGKETCDGDPCAVAEKLANSNINVRVHVVGFDVPQEDREQLECIARLGQGQYFSADSTEGLKTAVKAAVDVVTETAPQPAPTTPQREVYFFDDFNGDKLASHWEVKNPIPDAYVVEGGQLLAFSGKKTGFEAADMPNLITLKEQLPSGNWDIVVKLSGELKSGRDQIWVGLRDDEHNFLASDIRTKFTAQDDYHGDQVYLGLTKRAGGEETKAAPVVLFGGQTDAQYEEFVQHLIDGQATLTLSKRGRSYHTTVRVDGMADDDGNPIVWETDKLTSLRPPGELTLGVSQWETSDGEVLVFVDSVEIVTVGE